MDLHSIETILRPQSRGELPAFRPGDAFLGGGTWLFSEPQPRLRRLIDLASLGWPALEVAPDGLHIAATCTLGELEATAWPAAWQAAALIGDCCRALLGSFKIRRVATVGGNICLGLPAAPMAALATALDGVCVLWTPAGTEVGERRIDAADFVTGAQVTALAPGEVLREIMLPQAALRYRSTFRQVSLTPLGRSAALLVGTRDAESVALTITASTPRPVRLRWPTPAMHAWPTPAALAARIDAEVTAWLDDVHGAPDWRRHVTHLAAADILAELAAS